MADIVDLREMSDEKLEEKLENAREVMFNLRFRHASSRLDNIAQLRLVRRDIAQFETVLTMRRLAVQTAAQQPEIASAVKGKQWYGEAHFDYEDSAWRVEILNEENDKEIASALVNLNQKKAIGPRRSRSQQRKEAQKSPIISYQVAG
jgi:large subunit ribosomal protein L29